MDSTVRPKSPSPLPALALFIPGLALAVVAGDGVPSWPQFRGPNASGVSLDTDHDGTITAADLARIKQRSSRAENVLLAIRPGGSGDITSTHVAWKFGKGLPYVPSPLFYDGRVYVVKDGGMISSVDAVTGKPFYTQERLNTTGGYYASPVAADGRLYLASLCRASSRWQR